MASNNNGNGSIPVGDIRFYDNYLPPLDAGDYVISVRQKVASTTVADDGKAINQTFPAQQLFSVVAPRFALDPADIHSVFPPADSSGMFDQNLPHIVLTKRNLPWERYLVEGNQTTPWLALLLLSPDEIIAPATPAARMLVCPNASWAQLPTKPTNATTMISVGTAKKIIRYSSGGPLTSHFPVRLFFKEMSRIIAPR